jgi:hypothetical protein
VRSRVADSATDGRAQNRQLCKTMAAERPRFAAAHSGYARLLAALRAVGRMEIRLQPGVKLPRPYVYESASLGRMSASAAVRAR